MNECTYLEDNKTDLMVSLLKVYAKAVQQQYPEQSCCDKVADIEAGCLDLISRETLTLSKERLLSPLAVILFRNTNDAEPISLPNFPRSMSIQIACLPHQRNL